MMMILLGHLPWKYFLYRSWFHNGSSCGAMGGLEVAKAFYLAPCRRKFWVLVGENFAK